MRLMGSDATEAENLTFGRRENWERYEYDPERVAGARLVAYMDTTVGSGKAADPAAVVALKEVEAIASLPSKEELISKVMFLINCQAQRLVTVISAVPRNLAIVIKQIGEQKTA
jgi:ribosomal protein L10